LGRVPLGFFSDLCPSCRTGHNQTDLPSTMYEVAVTFCQIGASVTVGRVKTIVCVFVLVYRVDFTVNNEKPFQ